MIITIDGPAGTGKTTVAKELAEKLGFFYVDTGAMYRMITWFLLQNHVNPENTQEIDKALRAFSYEIKQGKKGYAYFVGTEDVTQAIRTRAVTDAVSEISALLPVRELLWEKQRALAQHGNAVFEGRDMGSVVLPQAEVKIFLTAKPEVRAQRRHKELSCETISQDSVQKDLEQRDAKDSSREIAPLRCPEGAHIIDTSDLSIEEVIDAIIQLVQHKGH